MRQDDDPLRHFNGDRYRINYTNNRTGEKEALLFKLYTAPNGHRQVFVHTVKFWNTFQGRLIREDLPDPRVFRAFYKALTGGGSVVEVNVACGGGDQVQRLIELYSRLEESSISTGRSSEKLRLATNGPARQVNQDFFDISRHDAVRWPLQDLGKAIGEDTLFINMEKWTPTALKDTLAWEFGTKENLPAGMDLSPLSEALLHGTGPRIFTMIP